MVAAPVSPAPIHSPMPITTLRHPLPSLACAFIASGILLAGGASAATLHVDAGLASGANDGSSWDNAYQGPGGLAAALAAASSGDEIWVKAGVHKPTTGTTRTISFTLKSGVAIYGGFAGGETAVDQRDPVANVTILSGDLLGNDPTITDNSYHVVRGGSANATAILDGFTITAGNANGPQAQDNDRGGGILMITASNGTIRDCVFVGNRCTFGGGAGYVRSSSPTFDGCRFENNLGGSFGGAFDCFQNCNPTFLDCVFTGNSAARAGALEFFQNCQPKLTNCVIWNNTATGTGGGGAMFLANSSVATVRNCTIAGNKANQLVGGILNNSSTVSLGNSIVWSNSGPGGTVTAGQQVTNQSGGTTTATYSTIQFGFAGTGNNGTDPLFVDFAGGDLHVGASSPAIDSGNNALVPVGVLTDLDGNPRFVDDPATADTGAGTPPLVDRGAYEVQAPPPCPADLDGNGVVDGGDLGSLLAGFGGAGPGDLDGSGTIDGGDLGILLAAWGDCP